MSTTTPLRPLRVIAADDNIVGSQSAFSPLGVLYPTEAEPNGWALTVPFTIAAGGASQRIGIVKANGYSAFSMQITLQAGSGTAGIVKVGMVNPRSVPNEFGTALIDAAYLVLAGTPTIVSWGTNTSTVAVAVWDLMSIWVTNPGPGSITITSVAVLYAATP